MFGLLAVDRKINMLLEKGAKLIISMAGIENGTEGSLCDVFEKIEQIIAVCLVEPLSGLIKNQ